jgi:hypothetical protein
MTRPAAWQQTNVPRALISMTNPETKAINQNINAGKFLEGLLYHIRCRLILGYVNRYGQRFFPQSTYLVCHLFRIRKDGVCDNNIRALFGKTQSLCLTERIVCPGTDCQGYLTC